MSSAHFKKSARNMADMMNDAGITFDVYQLLNMVDVMVNAGMNFAEPVPVPEPDYRHEVLVSMAMKSAYCLNMVQQQRNIMAIKELRTLAKDNGLFPDGTQGTLMPCKNAILDDRVKAASALWSNPWTSHHGSDEPPF